MFLKEVIEHQLRIMHDRGFSFRLMAEILEETVIKEELRSDPAWSETDCWFVSDDMTAREFTNLDGDKRVVADYHF